MITQETATDIAVIYRDIEAARKLRQQVVDCLDRLEQVDIRDVFGRRVRSLEMHIPSGDRSSSILHVPFDLALPVIDATIASHQAKLQLLNSKVFSECTGQPTAREDAPLPDQQLAKGDA